MAWLARLDSRTAQWPPLFRSLYLLVKWSLIALGAFLLFRTYLDRLGIWRI